MIGSSASPLEFLLRETVNTARQLGELSAVTQRHQTELTDIRTRLTAAEMSIQTMRITSPSSPIPETDTPTPTGIITGAVMKTARRFGPRALIWIGEKMFAWLAYYITPVLLGMWGFATDQFYLLMGTLWHLVRLLLRPLIGL